MFFTNDKNFFLEAKITIFVSLVIWFTITPQYFPLQVKGSVGIFEGPHLFGQFQLSFLLFACRKDVKRFLYCSLKSVATESNV